MSDGPEWFAPKRFGVGPGVPISWQGWALTIGFIAIVVGLANHFAGRPLVQFGIGAPVTILFIVIAVKTTRDRRS
jgi:hypothetical protein